MLKKNTSVDAISFRKAQPKEKSLKSIVGLASDKVADDPVALDRQLSQRQKEARQIKKANIDTAATDNCKTSAIDYSEDIKMLNQLMAKTDRLKIRAEKMEKMDQNVEADDQMSALTFISSDRKPKRAQYWRANVGEAILSDLSKFEVLTMPVGGRGLYVLDIYCIYFCILTNFLSWNHLGVYNLITTLAPRYLSFFF